MLIYKLKFYLKKCSNSFKYHGLLKGKVKRQIGIISPQTLRTRQMYLALLSRGDSMILVCEFYLQCHQMRYQIISGTERRHKTRDTKIKVSILLNKPLKPDVIKFIINLLCLNQLALESTQCFSDINNCSFYSCMVSGFKALMAGKNFSLQHKYFMVTRLTSHFSALVWSSFFHTDRHQS